MSLLFFVIQAFLPVVMEEFITHPKNRRTDLVMAKNNLNAFTQLA